MTECQTWMQSYNTRRPSKKKQGEGRDGVEYLPNTCNTSNPDVPHPAPSGSHPQPSAGEVGQPGECTVGVRNAGCLPHTGRWILHSWRWEGGDGQHQKTKRWEVNAIYEFYQHRAFCSPQTRQWVCVLWLSEQQKSFSQEYFLSSFLVCIVNHCGLTDSVQEEIHPYVTLLHWFTNTTGDCSGQSSGLASASKNEKDPPELTRKKAAQEMHDSILKFCCQ